MMAGKGAGHQLMEDAEACADTGGAKHGVPGVAVVRDKTQLVSLLNRSGIVPDRKWK